MQTTNMHGRFSSRSQLLYQLSYIYTYINRSRRTYSLTAESFDTEYRTTLIAYSVGQLSFCCCDGWPTIILQGYCPKSGKSVYCDFLMYLMTFSVVFCLFGSLAAATTPEGFV